MPCVVNTLKMFSLTRSVVGRVVASDTQSNFLPRNFPPMTLIFRYYMDLHIEVNLKTIIRNIKITKSHLSNNVRFCAVVKANAYGMGITRISHGIQPHVDMFAVARISEAINMRKNGIIKPILLFGICEDYKQARKQCYYICVDTLEARECVTFFEDHNTYSIPESVQ